MTQEALKLALEFLEDNQHFIETYERPEYLVMYNDVIEKCKEALAQEQEPVAPTWWPAVENILNEYGLQAIDFVADFKQALAQEQEPVAWFRYQQGSRVYYDSKKWDDCQPLYTHPPQRTEQLKACVYCGQLVMEEKK